MRHLVQPGPVHPDRIESIRGDLVPLRFTLRRGLTLTEALTGPLVEAGFQSATVVMKGGALNPFRYVVPGPADDASHVAYFTAPRAPQGVTRIEQANATFGWADGKPSLHCHAAWMEPGGARRGGHILPGDSIVCEETEVEAWGFRTIRVAAALDSETNFTLFQPSGISTQGDAVFARVKPNEDILTAVEAVAAAHGLRNAAVRGSLGSLIGARFADDSGVEDHATEVLVRRGAVRNGKAEMDLLVVDMAGQVHDGILAEGQNPVCITFDLVLEREPPKNGGRLLRDSD
jgi:predicted DNA-binding protein with PD1-like motif